MALEGVGGGSMGIFGENVNKYQIPIPKNPLKSLKKTYYIIKNKEKFKLYYDE